MPRFVFFRIGAAYLKATATGHRPLLCTAQPAYLVSVLLASSILLLCLNVSNRGALCGECMLRPHPLSRPTRFRRCRLSLLCRVVRFTHPKHAAKAVSVLNGSILNGFKIAMALDVGQPWPWRCAGPGDSAWRNRAEGRKFGEGKR